MKLGRSVARPNEGVRKKLIHWFAALIFNIWQFKFQLMGWYKRMHTPITVPHFYKVGSCLYSHFHTHSLVPPPSRLHLSRLSATVATSLSRCIHPNSHAVYSPLTLAVCFTHPPICLFGLARRHLRRKNKRLCGKLVTWNSTSTRPSESW